MAKLKTSSVGRQTSVFSDEMSLPRELRTLISHLWWEIITKLCGTNKYKYLRIKSNNRVSSSTTFIFSENLRRI